MKRHWVSVAVVALAVGLMASSALVQTARPGGAARRARGTRMGMMGMRGGGFGVLQDYTRGIRDLSPEQQRQIAAVRAAAMEKYRELEAAMNRDIKKLLTPAQVQAMEEAQKRVTHRGPDGVIMTDAQKKIMDDARAQAAKVDSREARMEIMRDAMEKIRASYTEEQKKQAEERRTRFQRGGRQGRGGRQPGGAGGGAGR